MLHMLTQRLRLHIEPMCSDYLSNSQFLLINASSSAVQVLKTTSKLAPPYIHEPCLMPCAQHPSKATFSSTKQSSKDMRMHWQTCLCAPPAAHNIQVFMCHNH